MLSVCCNSALPSLSLSSRAARPQYAFNPCKNHFLTRLPIGRCQCTWILSIYYSLTSISEKLLFLAHFNALPQGWSNWLAFFLIINCTCRFKPFLIWIINHISSRNFCFLVCEAIVHMLELHITLLRICEFYLTLLRILKLRMTLLRIRELHLILLRMFRLRMTLLRMLKLDMTLLRIIKLYITLLRILKFRITVNTGFTHSGQTFKRN